VQHEGSHSSPGEDIANYPGLSYYRSATYTLGNHNGGTTLAHAQAFLLAGLYTGLMARVIESYMWIQNACRVLKILIDE